MTLPRAAAGATCPYDAVERYRFRHPLEFLVAAFLRYEESGRLTLHPRGVNRAWLYQRLHTAAMFATSP